MAKLITGKNAPTFHTIRDGMEKVFNKTGINPMTAHQPVKEGKVAVFIPLAVRGRNGGWIRTGDRPCINIPDENGKGITQYAIGDLEPIGNSDTETEYALFVKPERDSEYKFYGVFSRIVSEQDVNSTYFKWKSDELELDEWQKQ